MASSIPVPAPVKHFFSLFPLLRYPANLPPPTPLTSSRGATLLIAPPPKAHLSSDDPLRVHPSGSHLSADVESLRWQAYLALRGVTDVRVSWAAGVEGGVPKLVLPAGAKRPLGVDVDSLTESLESETISAEKPDEKVDATMSRNREVLDAARIPAWVDSTQGRSVDMLEGFIDDAARDESRAWTVLVEGVIRSVLLLSIPTPPLLTSLLRPQPPSASLQTTLSPPPAPLTGLSTPLPLPQTPPRVPSASLRIEFREAMRALSGRLDGDDWFLGSSEPTALDALIFAHLHGLLQASDDVRREVTQRSNLIRWHRRVKPLVEDRVLPLE
ncbi:glutathione S-transferase [Ceratobasidium sp. AG-Ba]|nr:glutathione S-transferase [Ceratobasidium sp. AG-Ba]